MRILVVDDELVGRRSIKQMMKYFGECQDAANGPDAVDAFIEAWENWNPFDLITLDIRMPEMDGTEVLKQIRKLELDKNVPDKLRVKILMVSTCSDKENVVESLEAGCDEYLVKPADRESISEKLRKLGLIET